MANTSVYGLGETIALGDHIVLPQENDAATPSLGFGTGNSGFYEDQNNRIIVGLNGVARWKFELSAMGSTTSAAALLDRLASTSTNPGHMFLDDEDTGMGRVSADLGCLIAGGVNVMQFGETGSAATLGFFGTTAVEKETGVAVSSAGIHAALVTLGLIAA